MKQLDPKQLARCVYHWICFQGLCGRSELFSEAYLSQPIGEYALSLGATEFTPECLFPPQYQLAQGRRRALDFVIKDIPKDEKQRVWHHAIESKYVTAKRKFVQEIYEDLFRLLWFQPTRQPHICKRWLVVAGLAKNIKGENFLDAKTQLKPGKGQRQIPAFKGLLSLDLNNHTRTKLVHRAKPELRALWAKSSIAFSQASLPDKITIRLAARWPQMPKPTEQTCWVWEVIRPQPDFEKTHPLKL